MAIYITYYFLIYKNLKLFYPKNKNNSRNNFIFILLIFIFAHNQHQLYYLHHRNHN